jgi:hypothetical protein
MARSWLLGVHTVHPSARNFKCRRNNATWLPIKTEFASFAQ